jgi:hypothetical protein
MALRWCAARMLEADHQFRRVNGHLHLPKLRAALEPHFKNVSAASQNEGQKVGDDQRGPPPKFYGSPSRRRRACWTWLWAPGCR